MLARIYNQAQEHLVEVQTDGAAKAVQIAPKPSGFGSSVNGGELLLLALATCFCNDLYREASKRKLSLTSVEVVVSGEFGAEGEAGTNFTYQTRVVSDAPAADIEDLIRYTDRVAEVHNTLRRGASITLLP
ncbi:OsmC family protein [Hymenobacter busanensis]|uniref:OsmC family protein n=2 Tax=Hymenobacter busanensis TaxID=2607656 RepID=A0A7L5A3C1_9BACT|nr:OsmC family protein [Hymenobacter busanensis]QHJ09763.1 OsmC family peroxiredoxin [Hymenobacter busanensis]